MSRFNQLIINDKDYLVKMLMDKMAIYNQELNKPQFWFLWGSNNFL